MEIDLDSLLQGKNIPGVEGVLAHRTPSLRLMVDLLDELRPKVLVETGCQHSALLDAHGLSTTIFAHLARRYDGMLHTVDIDEGNMERCRTLTTEYRDRIVYVVGDSVKFLQGFSPAIDFLYLDSFDFARGREEASRKHQLLEIEAAWPKLRKGSIILLDDAWVQMWFDQKLGPVDIQGKTYYTHRFLTERAECLLDTPNYQRVYRV
jgi:predicted O-methyltransferase YrrM